MRDKKDFIVKPNLSLAEIKQGYSSEYMLKSYQIQAAKQEMIQQRRASEMMLSAK